jgi:UDP-N-acetylglucosamine--N-acetylmuramyl-(pentapeptide) pyrophosphoryl-undecaprenol N-acetylglucosamine transferase
VARRILLAGGGTGGHLVPALNLAAALTRAEPAVRVLLVGSYRGIEARVLPGSGWPFRLLPMEPLYRSRPWRNWRLVRRLPSVGSGLRDIFREFRPRLVVGTGGYASAPAVAWGVATGRRTALQEQNAMPGLVTRLLSSRVDQVHLGYPEARRRIRPGRRTRVFDLGNPVALADTGDVYDWPVGRVVAVVGGSQGARGLNERLLTGLGSISTWPSDVHVVWITGPAHRSSVEARVRAAGLAGRIRVVPFIPDLGGQLGNVTLAVCRAGAMSCAELAAAGVPAILVPLPFAAADHQRYNAQALVEAGGALAREEASVDGGELWGLALELLEDGSRLRSMAQAMRARGRPDAADRIARELLGLLGHAESQGDE